MLTAGRDFQIPDSYLLERLTRSTPDREIVGSGSELIRDIQYDSRKIGPGDLFVALAGGYADGHDYIDQALSNGAAALLVERPFNANVAQVIVKDTRAALARVAATFYGHPSHKLDVIGITGTDGKTTTSFLTEGIFREAGHLTGTIGTIGVRINDTVLDVDTRQTTPESLDLQRYLATMVNHDVRTVIVEATSHGLDLHRLDDVRFVTGAVTNVTHEHLEHHKTIAAYRRAKGILFERVGETGGNAVVNLDDKGAREMVHYARGARIVTYSAEGGTADAIATDIELQADGSQFNVTWNGNTTIKIETPLAGAFNVANALCALSVAQAHDISLEVAQKAPRQTRQIPGRMEVVRRGQPFAVIVDYAHTPESIEKVLLLLRKLTKGKLILVMGSAGERDKTKRPLQGAVAARLADVSIFTTEDPRFEDAEAIISDIAAGALLEGAIEGREFYCISDRKEAIARAISLAAPGDCVLLAGKGHERSIIWGDEKREWNEAMVAIELLEQRGFRVAFT